MTPDPRAEEALAEALQRLRDRFWATHITGDQGLNDDYDAEYHARSILAALPEGWTLIGPEQQAALADGEALARLREALPPEADGIEFAYYRQDDLVGWRVTVEWWADILHGVNEHGPTIAAAADAAREALG